MGDEELARYRSKIDTNETNIWILSGAFGGILAVLLVLTIILLVQNSKLKKDMRKLRADVPWARGPPPGPAMMPRAAPSKAGGSMYSGNYGDQSRY